MIFFVEIYLGVGCFFCVLVFEINFFGKYIIEIVDVENSDVVGCFVWIMSINFGSIIYYKYKFD